MMRCIYRYTVPVDGRPHAFKLFGDPLHVAATGGWATHAVGFWAQHIDGEGAGVFPLERHFQAFGTGQPVPQDAKWVGTTERTGDGLVWHLFEVYP